MKLKSTYSIPQIKRMKICYVLRRYLLEGPCDVIIKERVRHVRERVEIVIEW